MPHKTFNSYYLVPTLMFLWFGLNLQAQCNIATLQGTEYHNSDCGEYLFQGLIGTIITPSGTCGNLVFTPPLTGIDNFTSSDETPHHHALKIYPNPTYGKCVLELPLENNNLEIQILDVLGRIRSSQKIIESNDTIEFDISNLQAGMYIIKLVSKNEKNYQSTIIKID